MNYKIETQTVFLDINGRQWSSYDEAEQASENIKKEFIEANVERALQDYMETKMQGNRDISINYLSKLLKVDKVIGYKNLPDSIKRGYEKAESDFNLRYINHLKT